MDFPEVNSCYNPRTVEISPSIGRDNITLMAQLLMRRQGMEANRGREKEGDNRIKHLQTL
jgi:hypothetical protein